MQPILFESSDELRGWERERKGTEREEIRFRSDGTFPAAFQRGKNHFNAIYAVQFSHRVRELKTMMDASMYHIYVQYFMYVQYTILCVLQLGTIY